MSERKCPLGEDCDLTLAYMMGAEKAKDTIKALRAEVDRLQGNLRAELGDHIHGTPCAQIRWQQEREELQAKNERLLAANRDVMLHWNVLRSDYEWMRAALEYIAKGGLAYPEKHARAALEKASHGHCPMPALRRDE